MKDDQEDAGDENISKWMGLGINDAARFAEDGEVLYMLPTLQLEVY